MRTIRLVLPVCALALVVAGCGQTAMVQATAQVRSYMLQGNYNAALATLRQSKEQKSFKEQDRVVYWMNEGMLLHLTGQYDASNKVLEQAEQRSAELFTKSFSKEYIKASVTSDAAKDYRGEDYECVMMNVIKALNFLALKKYDSARVEARKINEKLALYNTKYQKKNVYNQDAFAHWLTGLLYETEKSYDDARISYVKALDVYKNEFAGNYGSTVPSFLGEDVVRASILSKSSEDVEKYKKELGASGESARSLKRHGEVILVHFNGEGPSKTDYFINCYFESAVAWWCDAEPGGEFMTKKTITVGKGTAIKVAFPQLIIRQPQTAAATLSVGSATAQSEVVEPISAIATKYLRDKMPEVYKSMIIRVITKALLTKGAEAAGEKAGGGLLGFAAKTATSVTMQATEEADKRTWMTLPSRIEVARVIVPPGVYDINIRPMGPSAQPIRGVKVEAGERVVVTHYTIP
jgi:uncharacterized protein